MRTRVGIELSPVACRVVELEGPDLVPGRPPATRVRSYAVLPPSGPETDRRFASLRRRSVAVVVWGIRSEHRQVVVSNGSYEKMRAEALAAARAEGVDTRNTIADITSASTAIAGANRQPVVLALANMDDVTTAMRPLIDARLRIRSVVTPADALLGLARSRQEFAVPGGVEAYVALDATITSVALIRNGTLLGARELPWGYEDGPGALAVSRTTEGFPRRDDLAERLVDELSDFLKTVGAGHHTAAQVSICGGLEDLRTMTIPLMERLDVEVEALDSLFGIDAEHLPEPAEEFRERAAELRLAWAAAADWRGPINLMRHRERRNRRVAFARAAVVAGVAAGLGAGWAIEQSQWWRSTAPEPAARRTPPAGVPPTSAPARARAPAPPQPQGPAVAVSKPPLTPPSAPTVVPPLISGPSAAPASSAVTASRTPTLPAMPVGSPVASGTASTTTSTTPKPQVTSAPPVASPPAVTPAPVAVPPVARVTTPAPPLAAPRQSAPTAATRPASAAPTAAVPPPVTAARPSASTPPPQASATPPAASTARPIASTPPPQVSVTPPAASTARPPASTAPPQASATPPAASTARPPASTPPPQVSVTPPAASTARPPASTPPPQVSATPPPRRQPVRQRPHRHRSSATPPAASTARPPASTPPPQVSATPPAASSTARTPTSIAPPPTSPARPVAPPARQPVLTTPPQVAPPPRAPALTTPPSATPPPQVSARPPASVTRPPASTTSPSTLTTPPPVAAAPVAAAGQSAPTTTPPAAAPVVQTPAPREEPVRAPAAIAAPPVVRRPEPVPIPLDAVLGTILYSPDRRLAIVNGRIVGIGDAVNGARIVDITPTTVLLRDAQGRLRSLTLGAVGRTPSAP